MSVQTIDRTLSSNGDENPESDTAPYIWFNHRLSNTVHLWFKILVVWEVQTRLETLKHGMTKLSLYNILQKILKALQRSCFCCYWQLCQAYLHRTLCKWGSKKIRESESRSRDLLWVEINTRNVQWIFFSRDLKKKGRYLATWENDGKLHEHSSSVA